MPIISIWQFLIMVMGVVSPILIAWLHREDSPRWEKITVSVLYHTVVAFIFLGYNHRLSAYNLSATALQLFYYSTLSYLGVWHADLNQHISLVRQKVAKKLSLGK